MALDEKCSRRPAHRELAIQTPQARRGIAASAGHENIVTGAREVAARHTARGLAEQRDRDCETIGTSDVAANHVGIAALCDVADSGIEAIEEANIQPVADGEVDY